MDDLEKILKLCKKGNRAAHDKLYKQFRNLWFGTSLRYSRNEEEAEDIFQEGLLQIFKDLRHYNIKKSKFSTWSNRVLIHAALKYLKKNHWQNTFIDIEQDQIDTAYKANIIENISANEIIKLISGLPMGYRLVFNLYVIEGFTHLEIAKRLEISIGTSKSQLFKARKMLKKVVDIHLLNRGYEI
ncbi:sigma-70 family RNA polymerase sigma factor [Saprospiraceae bacterium]|nr:sigma-70 family RNA polymerase sigma factor [Saprospiraceae bacterium]